ncbi:MAG: tRNA (uridine(34)/cytosine(34)/5-carboxymethylaminomethyluridine(34)-2'-O)-methyltransferase TrmL [Bacilli bacterium]
MINIVLYEPEIPQNTGNIMRTCVATGSKLHLIEPLGFKMDDKTVRRCGVNYVDDCDYTIYKSWEEFESLNKGTYFFTTRYGHKPHSDFNYKDENIYLIFGKESTGIPKEILKKHLDNCMRIPMTNKTRALNLSNCVALVLYEALRQNNYFSLLRDEPFKGQDYLEK